ncbi:MULTISPECIES: peptidoglycan-binding domain-containing protein [Cryobacterium]|nr:MULTISPECIES: peptidoglycan-binding domain-containing protein [Cryobacterium]
MAIPILVFVLLIPVAQRSERAAVTATLPTVIQVGSREADFRQSVVLDFTLSEAGTVKSNTSGRLTALSVNPTEAISSGTRLFDVDGSPVFAMPQTPPLYRDLEPRMSGTDVAAMQRFLVSGGFLEDSTENVNGKFGVDTEDAVCAFQKANFLACSEVFSFARVAYVPANVTAVGTILPTLGDVLVEGDAVIEGTPLPISAKFTPAAENGDLIAFADQPILVSASDSSEIVVSTLTSLDATAVLELYKFALASAALGTVSAASEAPGSDATGSDLKASYAGLMLRKQKSTVVAAVPGNSILMGANGESCVVAVTKIDSTTSPDGLEYRAVPLASVAPAAGELGQVFTDVGIVGLSILRDPSTASPSVQSKCS